MINHIFKNQSIFFTITITFLISILLIIVSFTVLYKTSEKREEHFINNRNVDVSRMVLKECNHRGVSNELKDNLQEMKYTLICNFKEQDKMLNNNDLILLHTSRIRRAVIQYIKLDEKYIIHITTPRNSIILVDNHEKTNKPYTLLAIFLVIFSAFILLYITTIKKLIPLKILKDQMKNLADEKFDIDCATTKQDEISQLANEFDKSAKKLKSIKESRDVFMRNIMHELKTPITKGKFLTQLPQNKQNIEKMQKVFYRLESLISEFTTIEELISTKKVLDKKEYYLLDIVDNASDILMCDEEEVVYEFDNIKIDVDFNLFSIAIKNLLDNGIKYSKDSRVKVKTPNNKIVFENIGEKLVYPLKNYFEPFFKGDEIKSNQSFGLGLYIVKHILDANNYKIEYLYENGVNQFVLDIN
jgi:two-component system, OmpR family, sensor kinase